MLDSLQFCRFRFCGKHAPIEANILHVAGMPSWGEVHDEGDVASTGMSFSLMT